MEEGATSHDLGTICELSITIGWVVATQIFFNFNPTWGRFPF